MSSSSSVENGVEIKVTPKNAINQLTSFKTSDSTFSEVELKKPTASELRKARRFDRNARDRLLSDSSSDELPLKGILKNACIPTKRSASECIEDISQLMADLDLKYDDFSGKFCPHGHYFAEEDEDDQNEDDGDDEESHDLGNHTAQSKATEWDQVTSKDNRKDSQIHQIKDKGEKKSRNCDRFKFDSDNNNGNERPRKSVRFDEHVYQTVYIASRLYDRRAISKYHFSARHHPPAAKNESKKKNSKSESKEDLNYGSDTSGSCKQTKSQRAKQSKRDKKKRFNRREETNNTDTCSSDDQGYSSSMHSFSD